MNTPMTPVTKSHRGTMLGLPVEDVNEWANRAYIIFGIIAIGATALALIASFFIWRTGAVLSRLSDEKIATAQESAGKANESAGNANERAASLEVAAADAKERAARLESDAAAARERAATMEGRVAELNLQIEKMRLPRTINDDQIAKMLPLLSRCSGTTFDLSLIPSDPEAAAYADRVERILASAGWKQLDWSDRNLITQKSKGGLKRGTNASTGLHVLYPIERQSEMLPMAACFKGAFDAVNAPADIAVENWTSTEDGGSGPAKNRLHIYVGKKPT